MNTEFGCSKKLSGFLYKDLSNSSSVNFITNFLSLFCYYFFKIGDKVYFVYCCYYYLLDVIVLEILLTVFFLEAQLPI